MALTDSDNSRPVVMGDWGPWLGIDPVTKKRTSFARPVWYPAGDAERAVVFQPGYRTDRKSYGRHGMEVTWLLRGGLGVTQFQIFTGWEPGLTRDDRHVNAPMGADLGYHALCPQWEGQEDYGRMDCAYLPGGTCFYDGSGLQADDLLRRFLIEGEEVVWQTLAERHDSLIAAASERVTDA
jgi:hypothetical protein